MFELAGAAEDKDGRVRLVNRRPAQLQAVIDVLDVGLELWVLLRVEAEVVLHLTESLAEGAIYLGCAVRVDVYPWRYAGYLDRVTEW